MGEPFNNLRRMSSNFDNLDMIFAFLSDAENCLPPQIVNTIYCSI